MLLVLLVSVVERLLAGENCERDRENERTRERGGGKIKRVAAGTSVRKAPATELGQSCCCSDCDTDCDTDKARPKLLSPAPLYAEHKYLFATKTLLLDKYLFATKTLLLRLALVQAHRLRPQHTLPGSCFDHPLKRLDHPHTGGPAHRARGHSAGHRAPIACASAALFRNDANLNNAHPSRAPAAPPPHRTPPRRHCPASPPRRSGF